jgi:hypothetical protein
MLYDGDRGHHYAQEAKQAGGEKPALVKSLEISTKAEQKGGSRGLL